MHVEFEVSERFSVSPELLYKAWLNSTEHTAMTGGRATASDNVGGKFSAWDGYISGENVALKFPQKSGQGVKQVSIFQSYLDCDSPSMNAA